MPRVFNQASRIRFVSVLRTAVSGNMTRHDNGLRPNTVPTSLGTLQTLASDIYPYFSLAVLNRTAHIRRLATAKIDRTTTNLTGFILTVHGLSPLHREFTMPSGRRSGSPSGPGRLASCRLSPRVFLAVPSRV